MIAALAAAAPASADGIGDENAPPEETCGLCHSLDGVSRMSKFPRLAGQKAAYIEKQLHDFRDGRRTNDGGQMAAIVTEFTDEKLRAAAQYFAGLTPPPPIAAERNEDGDRLARDLFQQGNAARGILACAGCHLPGSGTNAPEAAHAPYLTAQHPGYLAKQLRDFREGHRDNDATGTMAEIAKLLSDTEITALAAYLASMPRPIAHAE